MKERIIKLALLGLLVGSSIALNSCRGDSINAIVNPDPSPSPSPTPAPINYLVQAIASQGGSNNAVTDVNAGETFKTSITGVTCVQNGVSVKCPIFGGYTWRQSNVPTGLCGEAGSVDSRTDSWACVEATYPASAEFEGCVLDFDHRVLDCASVKVRVH